MLDEGVRAGFKHLGISLRTIAYAEWEAAAASQLLALMEAGAVHEAPIWCGDFRHLNATQFRGVVDCVIAGFPCFVAGTSILTKTGYRSIETLCVGDVVLTHTGAWCSITSVMQRPNAVTRRITGTGILPIVTTDEHPFLVRERSSVWNPERRSGERAFAAPRWVDAETLDSKHFTGQVLPPEQPDARGPDFWWLIGRYLADGWRVDRIGRKNGRVVICANKFEAAELHRRITAAGFNTSPSVERTVTKFHITKGEFYEFLEPFGRLASGKTLPGWCLELPVASAKALFNGWATGDGRRNEKQRNVSVTTVSRELALGMALLAQRAFGRVANIYFADMPKTCVIEGRVVQQRGQYTVRVCDRNRSSIVDGNYGWRRVRSNERHSLGDVFNISVEGDQSYIANGAIVHNCQDLSLAGRRAGLDGKRSGLFFNVLDVAEDCKARYLVLENVSGIASATASVMDETEGELYERAAARVLGELADRGWDAEWITLSAAAVGASHGRNRWFCFAWKRALGNPESQTTRGLSIRKRMQNPFPEQSGSDSLEYAASQQCKWDSATRWEALNWAEQSSGDELGDTRLQHQLVQQRNEGPQPQRAGDELANAHHAERSGSSFGNGLSHAKSCSSGDALANTGGKRRQQIAASSLSNEESDERRASLHDNQPECADAALDNARRERRRAGHEQDKSRSAETGGYQEKDWATDGGGNVDDPKRAERRPEHIRSTGAKQRHDAGGCETHDRPRLTSEVLEYAELPGLFAPGPRDPIWNDIINASRIGNWSRDVADDPAASCPWTPSIEPGVRVLADGLALVVDESRNQQLRQVGNGVVPLQASVALVTLVKRAFSVENNTT